MGLKRKGNAVALALTFGAAIAAPTAAQAASPLTGDYVCAYGCRLTDANPGIAVKGDEADCVNELGGLFRGQVLGADAVACFRKIGRLSPDGLTLTWSDGVIWRRHLDSGK
jgi:ABC-type oligopeptide transport system substrate-binding subunit